MSVSLPNLLKQLIEIKWPGLAGLISSEWGLRLWVAQNGHLAWLKHGFHGKTPAFPRRWCRNGSS